MTKFFHSIIFLGLIGSTLLCACTSSQEVVATVDGSQITRTQVRNRLADYDEQELSKGETVPEQQVQFANARATLTQLINERLLLIEAQEQGFLTDIKQITPDKQKKAIQQVLEGLGKKVAFPSYNDAYRYYQQHNKEFSTAPRYQLDHLLVAKENRAWELKEQIEKGKLSMAEAARQLGAEAHDSERLLTGAEMPAGVAVILPNLKLNQISPPIATPYGYHLIRIKKRLPAGKIPFSEIENKIKDQIFAKRLQKNYQDWLKLSREQHTIKIYPQHLTGL